MVVCFFHINASVFQGMRHDRNTAISDRKRERRFSVNGNNGAVKRRAFLLTRLRQALMLSKQRGPSSRAALFPQSQLSETSVTPNLSTTNTHPRSCRVVSHQQNTHKNQLFTTNCPCILCRKRHNSHRSPPKIPAQKPNTIP